ncbi:group II intron reverse transcriptase/maturase [Clostridium perfringens]|uniref:HNH endonuclease domain protein n=1 Tax=Clostridium perfringens TaxID=1502 RepID=A0A133N7P3_CLOPF|nr:group II intron reverse transcriptase/maturase [Clostridium perfringens]KXA12326.1 HNH endonuclease domain protein [Clostridium perfringens]
MKKIVREEILLKDNKLRYAEYYGMTEIFDELYAKSKAGNCFKNLMDIITSTDNIKLAYRTIKRNSGSITPGIDGVTIKKIENLPQDIFINIVRKRFKRYKPRKVKRVDIPKNDGKTRPLGIPSMWDRIVQQCILQVLEPICEAKFYKHSYGFRPIRSCENAIAMCMYRMNQSHMSYVVDIDIKGFFDNVNHVKLMRQLWSIGIRDKALLVIIRRMLKAPIVMSNGDIRIPTKGTPQGGILSPLLANVVLNEFDWWIAKQWEERTCREMKPSYNKKGYLDKSNSFNKLRKKSKLKEMYIVRYCDDFKVFCKNKRDAMKIFYAIKMWLSERLKLQISEEKSKITNLEKENSEFLGFTLRLVKKGKKKVCYSHVTQKAKKKIKNNLKEQIKRIRNADNKIKAIVEIQKYNSMIIGIHNYYNKATHVNNDFKPINYQVMLSFYNYFKTKGLTKIGVYKGNDKGIKKYIKSKQIRYLFDYPILPLGYIRTWKPKLKQHCKNKYTPEGRIHLHKEQEVVPEWKLQWLREHPVINERASVEYNDNRISLFVSQKGKCAITGVEMFLDDMHCHHKRLWSITKDDSYKNLILVTKNIHELIHMTDLCKIKEKIIKLSLSNKQLKKVNELRKLINNFQISIKSDDTYNQLSFF